MSLTILHLMGSPLTRKGPCPASTETALLPTSTRAPEMAGRWLLFSRPLSDTSLSVHFASEEDHSHRHAISISEHMDLPASTTRTDNSSFTVELKPVTGVDHAIHSFFTSSFIYSRHETKENGKKYTSRCRPQADIWGIL